MQRLLGRGGMGEVYLAHDTRLDRLVAIKRLSPTPEVTPAWRDRLRREARIAAQLNHPAIVQLYDIVTDGDVDCLIMEYVAGESLRERLARGPLAVSDALAIGQIVAEAVRVTHDRGVVHRDLKSENILCGHDGAIKVSDFGIAKLTGDATFTHPGHVLGTARAMSPEQALGRPVDHRSDIFSFGVLLYEMLAGQSPFSGATRAETIQRVLCADPAPLTDLIPTISPQLDDLVQWLLDKNPAQRPADLAMVCEELAEVASIVGDTNAPVEQSEPAEPGPATATAPGTFETGGGSFRQAPHTFGRYQLRGELGRGGIGVVYRAWDPDRDVEVALKVLLAGQHATESQIQRFFREADAVARLDHPAVVRTHDVGECDGKPFFTMDVIDGATLKQVLHQRGGLPVAEALSLIARLARGVAHAHGSGLIHRDIKPSNILVRGNGQPLLGDFGLVLELDDDATRMTQTEQVLGTVAYMAPEQRRGQHNAIGPHTDVYSLGLVLAECLLGHHPWQSASLHRLAATDGSPHAIALPASPRSVVRIVHKATTHDIADRYATAAQLADDIERYLDGHRIRGSGALLRARVRRHWRRYARPAIAAAIAIVVVLGAVLGWRAWQEHRERAVDSQRQAQADQRLDVVETRIAGLLHSGNIDEADRAFHAFVDLRDNRGTAALSRAFLHHAQRLYQRGDGPGEARAYANAYATAMRPDQRWDALVGLARQFHRQWSFPQLRAVLDLLRAGDADIDPSLRRELASMEVATSVALGDLNRATVAQVRLGDSAPSHRALFAQLARVIIPEAPVYALGRADVDGDGQVELITWSEKPGDTPAVVRADAGFSLVTHLDLPAEYGALRSLHVVTLDDGSPPMLLANHATGGNVLYQFTPTGLSPAHRWHSDGVRVWAAADLDRDGRTELYIGAGRTLDALHRDSAGRWHRVTPHAATNRSNSDIDAIVASDFDGDGEVELAVAAGAWRAYDVRVLRGRAGSRALTLVARHKVGSTTTFALPIATTGDTALAVTKLDRYANQLVFPPGRPYGDLSEGLHIIEFRDRALRVTESFTLPDSLDAFWGVPGDINGDGRIDAVVRVGSPDGTNISTALYIQTEHGGFDNFVLHGLDPWRVIDVDGDGDAEVLAKDHRGRFAILGAGDAPVPAEPGHEPVAITVPSGIESALHQGWARAEELASLGFAEQAAGQIADLASVATEPSSAAMALTRAAELRDRTGDEASAAALHERAARHTGDDASRRRAMNAYERAYRFDRALRVAERASAARPSPEWDADVARLRTISRAERLEHISLSRGLDSDWRVDTPGALHRRDDGLEVATTYRGPLVRRLVDWDGGPLSLEVDVTIEQVEWGGHLSIGLRNVESPDDRHTFSLDISSMGGGGVYYRKLTCQELGPIDWRMSGPGERERVTLRSDFAPKRARQRCSKGETMLSDTPRAAPPAGRYELIVETRGIEQPGRVAAVIHSIRLIGATTARSRSAGVPTAERADQRVYRQLVNRDYEPALRTLADGLDGAHGRTHHLLRYVALDAVGRFDEAETALAAAVTGASVSELPPRVRHLLRDLVRRYGERITRILARSTRADQYLAIMWDAWQVALLQHSAERPVQTMLTTQTSGLRRAARRRFDLNYGQLLLSRAHAWMAENRPESAHSDLALAIELASSDSRAQLSRDERHQLAPLLAALHQAMAGAELARGHRDAALDQVRAALRSSSMPEVRADMARFDPALSGLRDHPDWKRTLDPTRAVLPEP